jgi:hypothetical protein
MKKTVLSLALMLGLSGCPGGRGGSDQNPNPWGNVGIANCTNCGFNAAVFSQSVMSSIPQAELTLSFAGDANIMNRWASMGQNPLFAYQGPMTIAGLLNVSSHLPFGMCQLPPGQYQVRTLQAGVYSMGVFQIPALEIDGPVRMLVSMMDAGILTNGNGVITGFSGLLLGQQGPVMAGNFGAPGFGLGSCMDGVGVRF